MFHCFEDIAFGGIGLIARFFVFAETKAAVHRAAHIQQEDDPVDIHLFKQTLVELADPGVGVAHFVQLFDKGQVLNSIGWFKTCFCGFFL